ncbi:MAG: metallophosphoesterase family protein, partial [Phycisphaerae bacterium]
MIHTNNNEPTYNRIAVFGGVYSNHLALRAAIDDAGRRNVDAIFCLGDLGAFGPHPDRIFPLLIDHNVHVVRGNYDDSIGRGLRHCQCGYTDPRDNHFAAVSYEYTYRNTHARWRPWLAELPESRRIRVGADRVLLCHGSPRR